MRVECLPLDSLQGEAIEFELTCRLSVGCFLTLRGGGLHPSSRVDPVPAGHAHAAGGEGPASALGEEELRREEGGAGPGEGAEGLFSAFFLAWTPTGLFFAFLFGFPLDPPPPPQKEATTGGTNSKYLFFSPKTMGIPFWISRSQKDSRILKGSTAFCHRSSPLLSQVKLPLRDRDFEMISKSFLSISTQRMLHFLQAGVWGFGGLGGWGFGRFGGLGGGGFAKGVLLLVAKGFLLVSFSEQRAQMPLVSLGEEAGKLLACTTVWRISRGLFRSKSSICSTHPSGQDVSETQASLLKPGGRVTGLLLRTDMLPHLGSEHHPSPSPLCACFLLGWAGHWKRGGDEEPRHPESAAETWCFARG